MKTQINIEYCRRTAILPLFLIYFLFAQINLAQGQIQGKIIQASVDDFQIGIDSSLNKIVLDVRDSSDYIENKIPMSIYAPSKAVLFAICDTLDSETNIFVYCTYGERSQVACEMLLNKGFAHIFNLKKGLTAWQKAKKPLEKF